MTSTHRERVTISIPEWQREKEKRIEACMDTGTTESTKQLTMYQDKGLAEPVTTQGHEPKNKNNPTPGPRHLKKKTGNPKRQALQTPSQDLGRGVLQLQLSSAEPKSCGRGLGQLPAHGIDGMWHGLSLNTLRRRLRHHFLWVWVFSPCSHKLSFRKRVLRLKPCLPKPKNTIYVILVRTRSQEPT